MHGQMRHMRRQLAIAREAGMPEQMLVLDGRMVRFAPGPAEIVERIPAGVLHVDGRLIVHNGPARGAAQDVLRRSGGRLGRH
jgi:ribonuclease J